MHDVFPYDPGKRFKARVAGSKVADVPTLVSKLKNDAKVL